MTGVYLKNETANRDTYIYVIGEREVTPTEYFLHHWPFIQMMMQLIFSPTPAPRGQESGEQ